MTHPLACRRPMLTNGDYGRLTSLLSRATFPSERSEE